MLLVLSEKYFSFAARESSNPIIIEEVCSKSGAVSIQKNWQCPPPSSSVPGIWIGKCYMVVPKFSHQTTVKN